MADDRVVISARDLQGILDALPERVALFRLDDLVVLYGNTAKAADYGLTPEQLTGRSLSEVLSLADTADLRAHLASLDTRHPETFEAVNHQDRVIEWVDRLVGGEDGPNVLSVGRDVTRNRRLAEEHRTTEARFRASMDEAPIGMALLDLDGRIFRANRALCELVGREESDLLTLTSLDITHPDDVALDQEYGRHLLAGDVTPVTIEKRFVRPDGSIVWGLLKTSVVRDHSGQPDHLVGQVIDVTERREHEASLERLAADERSVADRLLELDDLKASFIAAVSHEMRTPLTALQGFSQLLQHRRHELSDAELDQITERLARNAERLGALLGDLLDLDAMTGEPPRTRSADADLAEVVARAVEQAPTDGRALLTQLRPTRLPLDTPKVARIVTSLLSNAVRHTPDGTTIWVEVRADGSGGRLTVADDGPGITDDLKRSLFDPFAKGPSPAASSSGSGIGLTLVSRFAELHAGRAWVTDREGGGAEVHVWFPAATSSSDWDGPGP